MKIGQLYDTGGMTLLSSIGLTDSLTMSLTNESISIGKGSTRTVRAAIDTHFESSGWVENKQLDPVHGSSINWFHPQGAAVQLQFGNMARGYYDLLKLQYLFEQKVIKTGVLVLFHEQEAAQVNSNVVNFERLTEEHKKMYHNIIDLPLLIIGLRN